MFSIKNVQELINLSINRSYLKSRVGSLENQTAELQEQVKDLEDWREQFTEETVSGLAHVNKRHDDNDERVTKIKKNMKEQLDYLNDWCETQDGKIKNINITIGEHKETHEDIYAKIENAAENAQTDLAEITRQVD